MSEANAAQNIAAPKIEELNPMMPAKKALPPDPRLQPKVERPRSSAWYDAVVAHPLSDAEFIALWCRHVFHITTDHSIKIVRNRAYKFIASFMAPELRRELAKYREHHG